MLHVVHEVILIIELDSTINYLSFQELTSRYSLSSCCPKKFAEPDKYLREYRNMLLPVVTRP